jgi:hypothetical protein
MTTRIVGSVADLRIGLWVTTRTRLDDAGDEDVKDP